MEISSEFVEIINQVICGVKGKTSLLLSKDRLEGALSPLSLGYDDDFRAATKVFRNLILDHPFQDANKRTACYVLLSRVKPTCTDKALANAAIDVANGKYSKSDDLEELAQRIYGLPTDKYEEELSSASATQSSSIGQHKVDSIDLIEDVGNWTELDHKSVPDSDGFDTDYTLYTDGQKFVCIFGDKEIYLPDDGEFDYETENEEDAREWFKNYTGIGDDNV